MKAEFIVQKNKAGEFYFNLKAENGEVIATSESYTTRNACYNGIAAVKRCAYGGVLVDKTIPAPEDTQEESVTFDINHSSGVKNVEVVADVVSTSEEEEEKVDFTAMTRKELDAYAKDLGLSPKKYKNKAEIIAAIKSV